MAIPLGAADAAALLGSHEGDVSTGLADRLEERKRARRRLRGMRLGVVLALSATVASGLWVAFLSPVFALSLAQVHVEGATAQVTADQVVQAVAPFEGIPLTLLDLGEVQTAIDGIELIKESSVTRAWPDGLDVTLSIRQVAMAERMGAGTRQVDEDGVVVSESGEVPAGMPVALLPSEGPTRKAAAAQVSAVWEALSPELRDQVLVISSDGRTVTLTLSGDRTARWGGSEDSELKAQVLSVLLAQRGASVYDVSAPTRPVTS